MAWTSSICTVRPWLWRSATSAESAGANSAGLIIT
jgi:hypothetical protein